VDGVFVEVPCSRHLTPGKFRNASVFGVRVAQADGSAPSSVAGSGTESDPLRFSDDLVGLTFAMLNRLEELKPVHFDPWGRFPVELSAAYRSDMVDRPIVDEYAEALRAAVRSVRPRIAGRQSGVSYFMTHDIDNVGVPFRLTTSAGHILRRGNALAFAQDIGSRLGVGVPARWRGLQHLLREGKQRDLRLNFYFKFSGPTSHDSGYDLRAPVFKRYLTAIEDAGHEAGIHPGYFTMGDEPALSEEIRRFREIFGRSPHGGRQHYLRWTPKSWGEWERAGLRYDSSVGWPTLPGFRAGTAVPYHPWNFEADAPYRLVEVPLVFMDTSAFDDLHLSGSEAISVAAEFIEKCRTVGGVFTTLWHNCRVIDSEHSFAFRGTANLIRELPCYEVNEC